MSKKVFHIFTVTIIIMTIFGCSTTHDNVDEKIDILQKRFNADYQKNLETYERLSILSTPESWDDGRWIFLFLDENGNLVQEFLLEFPINRSERYTESLGFLVEVIQRKPREALIEGAYMYYRTYGKMLAMHITDGGFHGNYEIYGELFESHFIGNYRQVYYLNEGFNKTVIGFKVAK